MVNTWQIYTDGGSRGNPGPSACAFIIATRNENEASYLDEVHSDMKSNSIQKGFHITYQQGFYLGSGTNNNAEYMGVLKACEFISTHNSPPQTLNFFLDSELVVKQFNGLYKIKDPNLQKLSLEIKKLLQNFTVTFSYIPREQNSAADLLVNQTLDSQLTH